MKTLFRQSLALIMTFVIAMALLVPPALASEEDMDAVSLAKRYVGYPYKEGGDNPSSGFNSAGLIYYIYNKLLGYNVPRELDKQYAMSGENVTSTNSLRHGDVLFFGSGAQPEFAGIYIGNRRFVMVNYTQGKVMERSLDSAYYRDRFMRAKRVLDSTDHAKAKIMVEAEKQLGKPYEFGAKVGQTNTFDCSSFVKHVFAQVGITLPRVSKNQAKVGRYVSRNNLEVGDLVFFTTPRTGKEIGHVGIYAGDGQFIHTYGEGGVKYTSMDHSYWKSRYVTARRVL